MRGDKLGLLYPHVDTSICIDCGRCVRACPFIHPSTPLSPQACYAAVNKDDAQRLASSSGGVFVALARQTISRGGVVFGAVFAKDWNVVHTYAETIENILPMMGSKYVQSDTRNTFGQAKRFLEDGREVFYTGTPCQIAGLKHFLGKDYPKLIAVEVICHGAPAPGVWQSYLKELLARPQGVRTGKNTVSLFLNDMPEISGISFRNKKIGWKKFGFTLRLLDSEGGEENSVSPSLNAKEIFQVFTENRYMAAFLRNWTLRPSCYACKAKGGVSQADMTIGDFWGVEKVNIVVDDDKGVSCVVCRTQKGVDAIKSAENLVLTSVDYDMILQSNRSLEKSVKYNIFAKSFQYIFPRKSFSAAMRIIDFCWSFINVPLLNYFKTFLSRINRFL